MVRRLLMGLVLCATLTTLMPAAAHAGYYHRGWYRHHRYYHHRAWRWRYDRWHHRHGGYWVYW